MFSCTLFARALEILSKLLKFKMKTVTGNNNQLKFHNEYFSYEYKKSIPRKSKDSLEKNGCCKNFTYLLVNQADANSKSFLKAIFPGKV